MAAAQAHFSPSEPQRQIGFLFHMDQTNSLRRPARQVPVYLTSRIVLTWLCSSINAWAGALENYVNKADTNYTWKKLEQKEEAGFAISHLELVSQQWRDSPWRHHMQVVRPEKVRNPGIAFLFITGDGDGQKNLGLLKTLSERAGAIAAVVTKIPNQPLYEGRKEDALIAYTFDQYLKTGDEARDCSFRW